MLSFMFYQANGSCNDDSKGAQSAIRPAVGTDGLEARGPTLSISIIIFSPFESVRALPLANSHSFMLVSHLAAKDDKNGAGQAQALRTEPITNQLYAIRDHTNIVCSTVCKFLDF